MFRVFAGRGCRFLACMLVVCATIWSDLSATALASAAETTSSSPPLPASAPQQLLIGFRPGTDEATRAAIVARHGGRIVQRLPGAATYLVTLSPQAQFAVAGLAAAREVRFVEPNYRLQLAPPPDDPRLGDLWGLERIAAPAAWATTTGSDAIVVGVVDTGIDHTHPDLADNIWSAPAGWNLKGCGPGTHGYRSIGGATGCAPGDTADDHGHGTHIAGTIGARGNNGTGVVGVNWRVKLMSLKALNANGATTVADVVAVLEYALAAKQAGVNLRVLNLGFSGTSRSASFHAILSQLNAAGVLVVAGAGENTGANDNDLTPRYPANYGAAPDFLPNVIAVAGSNRNDGNEFNVGANSVHLSAPGVDILSTTRSASYGTGVTTGTDSAAAHVSGAAALLLAAPGLGSLGVAELKARLMYCGDTLAGSQATITRRRLNVAQSLAGCAMPHLAVAVTATPADGGTAVVAPSGANLTPGSAVSLTATAQPGYRFTAWRTATSGDLGASNPLTLTLFQSHTVEAIFEREQYRLELTTTTGGSAEVAPSGEIFAAGTSVQIAATPSAGYAFVGWTLNGNLAGSANPFSLTMARSHVVHATFAPLPSPATTFDLDLSASAGGSVAANTAGPYLAGARVQLSATADQGYVFTGWTIDDAPGGDSNPLTLTMSAHRRVRAEFAPAHALRLSWTQGGSVRAATSTWEGGSPYPAGTVVALTATTNSDYVFTGWTVDGEFAGWANPLDLTVGGERTVVANFARRRHFTDLPLGPPPYEQISQLTSRQIIYGYKDGAFGPQDTTQRSQMAALIARAMGWDRENHHNPFTDPGGVDPNLWRHVGTLAHHGVARGYGDGRFGTFDNVTEAQVIAFITRGMVTRGLWVAETSDDPALYPDLPLASGLRLNLVTYHRNAGALPRTDATQPWPTWNSPATRGWFAEILWQAIDSYYRVDRIP